MIKKALEKHGGHRERFGISRRILLYKLKKIWNNK
ncbi:hypothetical protein [Clostridium sediminicola]